MIPHFARKLAAAVRGMDASDPSAPEELAAAGVPNSDVDCRACADPCDEGHEEYSRRFDVDLESEMRGSVKPYHRQVLISTGKADWQHDIASDTTSLAHYLSSLQPSKPKSPKADRSQSPSKEKGKPRRNSSSASANTTGVMSYASTTRLAVLNGSHTSRADDPDTHDTVLVLPDYVAVANVPRSAEGAQALYKHALDPNLKRAGTNVYEEADPVVDELQTWTLPYNCLIMLCSHKKRDARCHIASQRLEADFASVLESKGWAVDLDLCDLPCSGPPVEVLEPSNTQQDRIDYIEKRLKKLWDPIDTNNTYAPQKRTALVLKNSHVGGHKFAGNVIIYFPSGASIWYGRVTPHEVPAIVQQTIIEGKILPPLLRGGLGIARPGCKSLIEW